MLEEHHLQGRLGTDEYEGRVREALRARTAADLVRLLTDLPTARTAAELAPRKRHHTVAADVPRRFWTWVGAPVAAAGVSAYFGYCRASSTKPSSTLMGPLWFA